MENGLFRKKSIDRISSPEALHDYMRVTGPRLWMILTAVVVLLAGFIVYASTATMENAVPVRVRVENYRPQEEETGTEAQDMCVVYSTLPADQQAVVKPGMTVRFGNETGTVSLVSVSDGQDQITVVYDMKPFSIPLADGEYDAELVLESVTPISFLWN